MVHNTEQLLRDSGLFTQVEPDWMVLTPECRNVVTYVNTSRGVVAKHNRNDGDTRFFFDTGGDTYLSSGWYTTEEVDKWILPVMRSDRAWKKYTELTESEGDLTIALDYL